jgi:hypothetical protein
MKLTPHEQNLIEAIRNAVMRESGDVLTITIGLERDGVCVRWESHGFQGNGAGSSFDEAYGRAWEDYRQKYGRVVDGEPAAGSSDIH